MLQIRETIISGDVLEEQFVCDLEKCRGACCVEGDSGAPLEESELAILDDNYDKIEPYLTDDGKNTIRKTGKYIVDADGDYVTPLVNGDLECAYTIFENGVAKCGIEKAYLDGAVNFHKPISCHLYPIRVVKLKSGNEALNYHRWETCAAACELGVKLKVPVYKFLKSSLVRKYGQLWYDELELAVSKKNG